MGGNLIELVDVAVKNKPRFGERCNHCGYCCLVEVCAVGKEWTGRTIGPCKLLVGEDPKQSNYDPDKHYCTLAIELEEMKKVIGAGSGCCAETQNEAIERIMGAGK